MIIKCIIFILIFLYITYRTGIILGHYIKNENKILNFLYGFLTLISVNQIILTPCVMIHTQFKIAFLLTIGLNFVLLVWSYFLEKPKKVLVKIDKITGIMCLLIISQMLLTTITYKSNADDSFYISLSTCNIDSEEIYMEEPSMGYKAEETLLSATEQIPTIELQIAIWSKISGINPTIMCHTVLPMIIIFITYLSYYYFATTFFDKKHSKIFMIILSVIFLFTGFSTRFRPGYLLLRTWQGKTIFLNIGVTMILASLIRLDKEISKKDIILLVISNLFSVALSSTAIFIVSFIYLSFGILKLIQRKWKDILYLIISFMPIIIYVIIFAILSMISSDGYFAPTDEVSLIEAIKFYKNYTYLIIYVIATIIIMRIGTKEAKRYFGYIQIINLLTIWNPLFSNIIKYLTSSATFWRVLWLVPIEFAIAYCVTLLFEKAKDKKKKSIIVICSGIILILLGKFTYSLEIANNLENIPQFILNQTNYILEQSKNDEEIVVLGEPEPWHNIYMRQLDSKIKLIYSRDFYLGKLKDTKQIEERTKLNQLYYGNHIYTIEEFNKVVENQKIDWMIINKRNINLINYVEQSELQKDCEIDGYVLYRAK